MKRSRNRPGFLRTVMRRVIRIKPVLSEDLMKTIVRINRVQSWFQRSRGLPMGRAECERCGRVRPYTIWLDGTYRCLPCLYKHAVGTVVGPDPADVPQRTMEEFIADWLAYRARHEAVEPSESALSIASGIWNLNLFRERRPLICELGACAYCGGIRPFMRKEDGDAGCIRCLMQGRIVEVELDDGDEANAG